MDTKRLMELAGLPANENDKFYKELMEVVQLPDPEDISVEDLARRLDHCKRALSLAAKLPEPDRKKWISACFVNLNKVRGALKKMISAQPNADIAPIKVQQATAPETDTNPPQLRQPDL